jgi:hypothetical protein
MLFFLGQILKPLRTFSAWCWWITPVILASQEAEIRRIVVQGPPRQIVQETLSQKYSTQKKAGGVAQVVECLPNKCEAVISNPSPARRKKKKSEHLVSFNHIKRIIQFFYF